MESIRTQSKRWLAALLAMATVGSATTMMPGAEDNTIPEYDGVNSEAITVNAEVEEPPVGGDEALPTVAYIAPENYLKIDGNIEIAFSENMDTSVAGAVTLSAGGSVIETTETWAAGSLDLLIVDPAETLAFDTAYTVNVSGYADSDGNLMEADNSGTVRTVIDTSGAIATLTGGWSEENPNFNGHVYNLDLTGYDTADIYGVYAQLYPPVYGGALVLQSNLNSWDAQEFLPESFDENYGVTRTNGTPFFTGTEEWTTIVVQSYVPEGDYVYLTDYAFLGADGNELERDLVGSSLPGNGTQYVSVDFPVTVTFTQPMNTATGAVSINGTPVDAAALSWNGDATVLTINADLEYLTDYTVSVSGFSSLSGRTMEDYAFAFTTIKEAPDALATIVGGVGNDEYGLNFTGINVKDIYGISVELYPPIYDGAIGISSEGNYVVRGFTSAGKNDPDAEFYYDANGIVTIQNTDEPLYNGEEDFWGFVLFVWPPVGEAVYVMDCKALDKDGNELVPVMPDYGIESVSVEGRTDIGLQEPIVVTFEEPMKKTFDGHFAHGYTWEEYDSSSYTCGWNSDGTVFTITPVGTWNNGARYPSLLQGFETVDGVEKEPYSFMFWVGRVYLELPLTVKANHSYAFDFGGVDQEEIYGLSFEFAGDNFHGEIIKLAQGFESISDRIGFANMEEKDAYGFPAIQYNIENGIGVVEYLEDTPLLGDNNDPALTFRTWYVTTGEENFVTIYKYSILGEGGEVLFSADDDDVEDTIAPEIAYISPSKYLPIDGNITIVFNEDMDTSVPGTVTLSTESGETIATTATWKDDLTLSADPAATLAYDTTYALTISGFTDVAGNLMDVDSNGTVRTVREDDGSYYTLPMAIGDGIEFDLHKVDPMDIYGYNVWIAIPGNGEAVGCVYFSSHNLWLSHNFGFPTHSEPQTLYYDENGLLHYMSGTPLFTGADTTFAMGMQSWWADGNRQAEVEVLQFQLLGANGEVLYEDMLPPSVLGSSPKDGASYVQLDTPVTVAFTQPMNTATGAVTLNGNDVADLSWNGDATVLTINTGLEYITNYTVSVSGFETVNGVAVDAYEFSFSTAAPDPGVSVDSIAGYFPAGEKDIGFQYAINMRDVYGIVLNFSDDTEYIGNGGITMNYGPGEDTYKLIVFTTEDPAPGLTIEGSRVTYLSDTPLYPAESEWQSMAITNWSGDGGAENYRLFTLDSYQVLGAGGEVIYQQPPCDAPYSLGSASRFNFNIDGLNPTDIYKVSITTDEPINGIILALYGNWETQESGGNFFTTDENNPEFYDPRATLSEDGCTLTVESDVSLFALDEERFPPETLWCSLDYENWQDHSVTVTGYQIFDKNGNVIREDIYRGLLETRPIDGDGYANVGAPITLKYSVPMNTATGTVTLNGNDVTADVSWNDNATVLTINADLDYETEYTVSVSGLVTADGEAMDECVFSFKTMKQVTDWIYKYTPGNRFEVNLSGYNLDEIYGMTAQVYPPKHGGMLVVSDDWGAGEWASFVEGDCDENGNITISSDASLFAEKGYARLELAIWHEEYDEIYLLDYALLDKNGNPLPKPDFGIESISVEGREDVGVFEPIVVTFNEPMEKTLEGHLTDPGWNPVYYTGEWNDNGTVITITPNTGWDNGANQEYMLQGFKAADDGEEKAFYSFRFRTVRSYLELPLTIQPNFTYSFDLGGADPAEIYGISFEFAGITDLHGRIVWMGDGNWWGSPAFANMEERQEDGFPEILYNIENRVGKVEFVNDYPLFVDGDGRMADDPGINLSAWHFGDGTATIYKYSILGKDGVALYSDVYSGVSNTSPYDGEKYAEVSAPITLTFTDPMAETFGTVTINDREVTADEMRWTDDKTLAILPEVVAYEQEYTVSVSGFVTADGKAADPYSFTFTTMKYITGALGTFIEGVNDRYSFDTQGYNIADIYGVTVELYPPIYDGLIGIDYGEGGWDDSRYFAPAEWGYTDIATYGEDGVVTFYDANAPMYDGDDFRELSVLYWPPEGRTAYIMSYKLLGANGEELPKPDFGIKSISVEGRDDVDQRESIVVTFNEPMEKTLEGHIAWGGGEEWNEDEYSRSWNEDGTVFTITNYGNWNSGERYELMLKGFKTANGEEKPAYIFSFKAEQTFLTLPLTPEVNYAYSFDVGGVKPTDIYGLSFEFIGDGMHGRIAVLSDGYHRMNKEFGNPGEDDEWNWDINYQVVDGIGVVGFCEETPLFGEWDTNPSFYINSHYMWTGDKNEVIIYKYSILGEGGVVLYTDVYNGIVSTSPYDGYGYAKVDAPITLKFTTPMAETFGAVTIGGTDVSEAEMSWTDSKTLLIQPAADLAYETEYTVSVSGFTAADGEAVDPYSFSFTTRIYIDPSDVIEEIFTGGEGATPDKDDKYQIDLNGYDLNNIYGVSAKLYPPIYGGAIALDTNEGWNFETLGFWIDAYDENGVVTCLSGEPLYSDRYEWFNLHIAAAVPEGESVYLLDYKLLGADGNELPKPDFGIESVSVAGRENVGLQEPIVVIFTEPMVKDSDGHIFYTDGNEFGAIAEWNDDGTVYTITPYGAWGNGERQFLMLKGFKAADDGEEKIAYIFSFRAEQTFFALPLTPEVNYSYSFNLGGVDPKKIHGLSFEFAGEGIHGYINALSNGEFRMGKEFNNPPEDDPNPPAISYKIVNGIGVVEFCEETPLFNEWDYNESLYFGVWGAHPGSTIYKYSILGEGGEALYEEEVDIFGIESVSVAGRDDVGLQEPIVVTFNEPMVKDSDWRLANTDGSPYDENRYSAALNEDGTVFTITPIGTWGNGERYTFMLQGFKTADDGEEKLPYTFAFRAERVIAALPLAQEINHSYSFDLGDVDPTAIYGFSFEYTDATDMSGQILWFDDGNLWGAQSFGTYEEDGFPDILYSVENGIGKVGFVAESPLFVQEWGTSTDPSINIWAWWIGESPATVYKYSILGKDGEVLYTAADSAAPTVGYIAPETYLPIDGNIEIAFNENMDTSVAGAVTLSTENGDIIETTATWADGSLDLLIVDPAEDLAYDTIYPVTISGYADLAGNVMKVSSDGTVRTVREDDRSYYTLPVTLGVGDGLEFDLHKVDPMDIYGYNVWINVPGTSNGCINVASRDNGWNPIGYTLTEEDNGLIHFMSDGALFAGRQYPYYLSYQFWWSADNLTQAQLLQFQLLGKDGEVLYEDMLSAGVWSTSPLDGQKHVKVDAPITVTFTDPMAETFGTVTINGVPVSEAAMSWTGNKTLSIQHADFALETEYTVSVSGFETLNGITATAYEFRFKTELDTSGAIFEFVDGQNFNFNLNGYKIDEIYGIYAQIYPPIVGGALIIDNDWTTERTWNEFWTEVYDADGNMTLLSDGALFAGKTTGNLMLAIWSGDTPVYLMDYALLDKNGDPIPEPDFGIESISVENRDDVGLQEPIVVTFNEPMVIDDIHHLYWDGAGEFSNVSGSWNNDGTVYTITTIGTWGNGERYTLTLKGFKTADDGEEKAAYTFGFKVEKTFLELPLTLQPNYSYSFDLGGVDPADIYGVSFEYVGTEDANGHALFGGFTWRDDGNFWGSKLYGNSGTPDILYSLEGGVGTVGFVDNSPLFVREWGTSTNPDISVSAWILGGSDAIIYKYSILGEDGEELYTKEADLDPLPVVYTNPANGNLHVGPNPYVYLAFNVPMDTDYGTIDTNLPLTSWWQDHFDDALSADGTYIGFSAEIEFETEYYVKLTGFRDTTGKRYADYTLTFTACAEDEIPQIVDVSIPAGATDVPVDTSIVVTFDRAMSDECYIYQYAEGASSSTDWSEDEYTFTWNANKTIATITINEPLAAGTVYNLTLNFFDAVCGINAYTTLTFTTAGTAALDPLPVGWTVPGNGSEHVGPNPYTMIGFNVPMDPEYGKIETNIPLPEWMDLDNVLWGETYESFGFNTEGTEFETEYYVKLSGFRDTTGKQYADYTFTFKTCSVAEVPKVISITPVNGAANVPVDSSIVVTFDRTMSDLGTVMFDPESGQYPAWLFGEYKTTWNANKTIATITPNQPLAAGTAYELEINFYEALYQVKNAISYRFITAGAALDPLPITMSGPAQGAEHVQPTYVWIQFDVALIPGSGEIITNLPLAEWFSLEQAFSADGTSIGLYTEGTEFETEYFVTLKGFSDVNGKKYADYRLEFTSYSEEDIPQVLSVSIADGATNVPVDSSIVVTFDRAMDDGPYGNSIRTYDVDSGALVVDWLDGEYTIEWNTAKTVATITPNQPLAAGSVHQLVFMFYDELYFIYTSFDLTFTTAAAASFMHGDVNGDSKVNNIDVILQKQYLAGWEVTVSAGADANGDGKINNIDVILLKQYLAGWEVTLG
jgi:methionine-rich copper-binding protein CopC